MDDDQQFCLRWNNHQSTLISVFDTLLENETLVDCTLAAEGKFLKAHKVVLSACSPYFATLLQEQYDKHPIFILKDVKYQELRAMMDYMYRGEVNISQDQLAALLKAAESLQIKGLSDNRTGGGSSAAAPKPESSQHHRGGKMSGAYTLEQTKRARLATGGAMDTSGDVSGSREGSSSPSRRRRKVRRRSLENDVHDNSNSSVLQAAASNQSILQQTSAGLAVSALVSTQLSGGGSNVAGTSQVPTQQQPLTSTNVTKKTESAKLTSSTAAPAHAATATAAGQQQQQLLQQQTSDAINTENVQPQSQGAQGDVGGADDMEEASAAAGGVTPAASGAGASAGAVHTGVVVKQLTAVVDKSSSNHKQKVKDNSVSSVGSEMVIEPKAEYDDDTHDENVEDLTLDEEDMTMEELDQTAGTSQGGEGSSQTYATWQHDRSQDELGLMAQDAQQRDPQDLSRKENTAPGVGTAEIQRSFQRSILNGRKRDEQKAQAPGSHRKRLSVSEVSDMLFEFYKTKSAKVPKQQQLDHAEVTQYGQVSPTSGETLEPSTIAAIAVYGSASDTASKNLNADEIMGAAAGAASFHPRNKYSLKTAVPTGLGLGGVKAIPTSVLVANKTIAPVAPTPKPQAAVIAEALMRNGLHSFQQQIRAQEIMRQQTPQRRIKEEVETAIGNETSPTKILENLLLKQQKRDLRHSECENEPGSSTEDEDDGRFHAFDDIHLMEQSGSKFGNSSMNMFHSSAHGGSTNSILEAQAQVFRNLEFTLSDYGGSSSNGSITSPNAIGLDGEPVYECRHCGKKYRWKSTLRRHENVECGGKEPSHQCPYCPYKSKQRGNLGVHVRKHHTDLPQLPSKRRSKYSMKGDGMSGSMSDDSQGKLIIDCNK
ncbi:longitudinals lacking protein isoform X3 [Drosophila miranda]|uniref:longitudinals lacking protein isoform X3 n=1 Tax=Drosophila miranda TaxID=7229 RepID=UPI0007E60F11|nr:longitudinals lacking protein isoform X3 [Drosophila miranda]